MKEVKNSGQRVSEPRTVKVMASLTPAEYQLLLDSCDGWAPSTYLRREAIEAMRRRAENREVTAQISA